MSVLVLVQMTFLNKVSEVWMLGVAVQRMVRIHGATNQWYIWQVVRRQ